ncbi:MAG: cytochrome b/b6 domain-containing protein [Acidobacteria bacterium]|nr:cytochrome b/b6 domain-containing protein [Acidobacteriota bacterium]
MLTVCAASAQKASEPAALDCLSCHSDSTLTSEAGGKTHSVFVDGKRLGNSVHGVLGCADCHTGIKAYPHDLAPAKVNCAACHADAQSAYDHSVHASAVATPGVRAPGCLDCHGKPHDILPSTDADSPTFHARIPQTCGACHGENFVMKTAGLSAQPFLSYQQSVHGKAVAAGNLKAAVCTDCHRNHEILAAGDSKSPIFKFNVPQTCSHCHSNVAHEFQASIHGQALQRGNWQAPVCTDCHGIHTIKKHLDPSSPVAAQNLALATCAQCHEGMRLSREFGVPGMRVSTYLGSYHGMASKLGSAVVANCASCHGVHNILPSSDPRSSINPAHLAETCGKCHNGATAKFALSKVHVDAPLSSDAGTIGTLWVRRIYILLISVTIGGMLLHNFLLWRRSALLRLHDPGRTIERINRTQRLQHLVLLISFIVLAITGFALKYPDSWIAGLLGWNEAVRRIGHRIAAAVMLAVGAWHLCYIAIQKDGRQLFRDFLPGMADLRDFRDTILYNLGRRSVAPRYPRFSYGEKVEYLSLIWGTCLMAITGLMLWFPTLVSRWLPRWTVDIAGAFHFYEAILAVLAILVWHFYFVLFDSEIYPINWAFWDGKVSEHYLRTHHAGMLQPGAADPLRSASGRARAAESSADD